MPELSYSYRVRVGPYEWVGTVGDAADYGPVDGLQIIRKLVEDSPLWPAQIDTAECRFQLVVESMDDVEAIELGTTVYVEVRRPAGGTVRESFAGRVADLTATPHDLGMVLTLSCLDYTADLRGLTVGAEPWPVESVWARIVRVIGLASPLPVTVLQTPPGSGVFPTDVPDVAARDVDAQDAYQLVQGYMDQWPVDYGYPPTHLQYRGLARMQLSPQTDVDGELESWLLVPSFENPAYTGPLRLELVAGKWTAVPVDNGTAQGRVLDASDVDVSATYAITKADGVTRVTVSDKAETYVVSADLGVVPPINATVEGVELVDSGDAVQLAGMYLPGEVPVTKWVADTFLWHVELSDPATAYGLTALGAVLTVGGIPTDQNPNQREWYTGQLSVSTFTLADKRATYEFQLRRPDFEVPNSGVATWNSAAIVTNAPTWATLNPRDTWDDYRLVRGSLA